MTGGWTENDGRAQEQNVSSPAGGTRVPSFERGRQAQAAGDSLHKGSRVVQMAAVLVLEPIFEAYLEPEQHAYRPERSALVRRSPSGTIYSRTGHTGSDGRGPPSGYFDSIPHAGVDKKSVSRRISDGRMLRLIKMWLETPVEEIDAKKESPSDDPEQGPGDGNAARCSDFPIVVEYLHAMLCERMENGRTREAT